MKKRYLYGAALGVLTIIVLAIILVSDTASNSRFEKYKQYANEVGVTDWTISEDTAKSFADSSCDKLAEGDMPHVRFRNEDHIKSSGSVIAAYCPESFHNFVAGILMNNPEYRQVIMYMNDRIEIEDS